MKLDYLLLKDPELTPRQRWLWLALLTGFCLFGLFDHGLWSGNDTREGAMIFEMYQSGQWILPTLDGVPYFEKPPLLHWLGAMVCSLFGTSNEGLVRLPAAIFAWGTLLLCWRWGCFLKRERAGLAAACMCATAIMFMEYARIVLTDMAVVFTVMLSLTFFYSAYVSRRSFLYLLFLISAAAAFFAKGLIGPGLIWAAVGLFLLARKEWKLVLILGPLYAVVFALVLAPWVYAVHQHGGYTALHEIFWTNQFGRFFTFDDLSLPKDPYRIHKEPLYYYLTQIPVAILPWTLLVVPALFWWLRKGRVRFDCLGTLITAALAGMLFLLHVSAAKVANYALPLYPFFFLVTALWLEQLDPERGPKAIRWCQGGTYIFLLVLLAALALTPFGYEAAALFGAPKAVPLPPALTLVSCLLALVVLALVSVIYRWVRECLALNRSALAASVPGLFLILLVPAGAANLSWYDWQRSYAPFAAEIKAVIPVETELALGIGNKENETAAFVFYMGRRLPVVPPDPMAADYLFNASAKRGLIVHAEDVARLTAQWTDHKFTIFTAAHTGYKSRSFAVLLNY